MKSCADYIIEAEAEAKRKKARLMQCVEAIKPHVKEIRKLKRLGKDSLDLATIVSNCSETSMTQYEFERAWEWFTHRDKIIGVLIAIAVYASMFSVLYYLSLHIIY